MAVDTPARIAIIGAGPVGLEAALYARFLGYDVSLFERGDVANEVARAGHLPMFGAFGQHRSPLGLAALRAHDESYSPPRDDAILTNGEWREHYLLPLSRTDLLSEHLHTQTTVLSVGREGIWPDDLVDQEERGDYLFRILTRAADGVERTHPADVVFDCAGAHQTPRWCGQGGIPAVGERTVFDRLEHHVPDVLGARRDEFAQRHTLVIGGGLAAATSVVALARLVADAPETRVTWITRHAAATDNSGPVKAGAHETSATRAALITKANDLARGVSPAVVHHADTVVQEIQFDDATQQFAVELLGEHAGRFSFDQVLANVGFRRETDRGAALHGAREPHFYALGAAALETGRDIPLLHSLEQIRDLFQIIGDRQTLDLYANAPR